MTIHKKYLCFLLACATYLLPLCSKAQIDTTDARSAKNKPSFLGKMINNFRKDTTEIDIANELERNDKAYEMYEGLIIRNIIIKRIPFGIPLADTSKKLVTTLTKVANELHHLSKTQVIKNNLFFKKNEPIKAYLMADNERFLRQLPYLRDADFLVVPVRPHADSADIIVMVKDVFSLGGAIGSLGLQQSQVEAREDNIAGSGNAGVFYALYDSKRKDKFALGGEYIRRNIGGSFIDGSLGYQSFYRSFNTPRQENYYYLNLIKPFINRYMAWTYSADLALHSTTNKYVSDSLYFSDYKYQFYNIETYAGYNIHAKSFTRKQEADKLRKLVGMRFINKKFQEIPSKYSTQYNWQYADLTALLATITFYRQNFYKSQYIYGFGRNEDIPEGLLMSFTTGHTAKNGVTRPFLGFNYERYHFNKRKNYIGYTVRAEGFLNKKSIEDINLLVALNYFDHLKAIGTKWKQRFFLNVDAAQQVNSILNEPLLLNSNYGLPEYGNSEVGGNLRATIKTESVFFSPWVLASFRFAPFIFGNVSVFSPYRAHIKIYESVGAGIRTRNESFVFGTVELKGFYFPKKNFSNDYFRVELSTNVIFKYKTQLVKKPDFIEIN